MNLRKITNLELSWDRFRKRCSCSILGMWKNYFFQLLDIHRADAVRQTEVT